MANLHQIQLVLWILPMSFQNTTGCRETAFDSTEEEETHHRIVTPQREEEETRHQMGTPQRGHTAIQIMIWV
jgi:hypothetical protein